MGKGKNKGKRLNKKQVADMLTGFFTTQPNETFSLKQIFRSLHLDTHPKKMLAMDVMEEMTWDDRLSKVGDNSYRLNTKGQVQEGVFRRKANGKNSFLPDGGGNPVFVAERNSLFALDGDRVRVSFMARRQNHIKEAMVTEILSHARDTFVGQLKVERDFAFLITESNIFVHDIMVPKKKLKGGKTGDKAVVRITQWPSKESKNIVGEVVDVLGKTGDNTVEMHAILAQYGLPYRYPKAVEEAAEKAERNHVKNLILWHTEDGTYGKRRELYTKEAAEYYHGHIWIPDDGDTYLGSLSRRYVVRHPHYERIHTSY